MIITSERRARHSHALSDFVSFLAAVALAISVGFRVPLLGSEVGTSIDSWSKATLLAGLAALWYGCLREAGTYDLYCSNLSLTLRLFKGCLLFAALTLMIKAFDGTLHLTLMNVAFVLVAAGIALLFRRFLPALFLRILGSSGKGRVLLLGRRETSEKLAELLESRIGYEVVRVDIPDLPIRGEQISQLLDVHQPKELVLVHERISFDELEQIQRICKRYGVCCQFSPSIDRNFYVHTLGGVPLVASNGCGITGLDLFLKRMVDLTLGSMIFVCVAPLMAAIWLIVRLTSKGPAIHVQERVGLRGQRFKFYKFRTMYENNDDSTHREYAMEWIKNNTPHNGNGKRVFKMVDDDRVTPVGHFLRRFSLDELPQIVNVLKLDMSLVGPRPPIPYEVDAYEEWHKERLEGPPGMTGLWQVVGRNHLSFDDMVKLDIQYLRNWSVSRDLKVLVRTLPAVLRGTGH